MKHAIKVAKKGHYQSMCKTGKVTHVEVDPDDSDTHSEVDTDVFFVTLTVHCLSETDDTGSYITLEWQTSVV